MLRAVDVGQVASRVAQRPTGRMQDASDEELVALIGGGDRRAYHVLVERHGRRVLGLARRMTRNLAEAEDISQDAFLRVWQKAAEWQPRGARFTTWLYRVVVNLCIDRRRKPSFAPIEAAGDPADSRPDAEQTLVAVERDRHVKAALDALPERQRAALVLSYYEGLSNVEAAGALELSVSALESLLVRARRALRQELQGRGVETATKEEP
ncbi:MAG TPA: RNA polymerase sigma factor [Alphaproteobacteria bacterium]|jgi:RNA polymerase sigma-70 factor (ECF subfamily)